MPTTDPDPTVVVARFAAALDADDFDDTVEQLIAVDCVCTIGEATHLGPEAITASYRHGSALARRLFDTVLFTHEFVAVDDHTFLVDFADVLTFRGDALDHHSVQEVTVGRGGDVTRIRDVTDPSERAKAHEFETRHGPRR